ncbi:acyl-CoA-binding protein [Flavobacterium sp. CYK-55]|uniref:acyl-CoA-binding protein n=1 Tax=Flavobacterium sp. CYK-55 TaxID=2835529 RepID=UPI001BD1261C|nr:acyl-CoA-binding protein [Flavobacterium sp. CYK-55]MBS7787763.1 acyl-CoA-binding protein [Flavobacterium sp. CYK-55]
MSQKDLDTRFAEAVAIAETMSQADLPQDVALRLYAYYKQATMGMINPLSVGSSSHIRDAFKTNAWMQISHLTSDQAKEHYIEIIRDLNQNKS